MNQKQDWSLVLAVKVESGKYCVVEMPVQERPVSLAQCVVLQSLSASSPSSGL